MTSPNYIGRHECSKQIEACKQEHARMVERIERLEETVSEHEKLMVSISSALRDLRILVVVLAVVAAPQALKVGLDLWKGFHG